MLKTYIISVVVWIIISCFITALLGRKIKVNGWADENETMVDKWKAIFIISTIPLVRILFVSSLIYMAVCTKTQYDGYVEKFKNNKEE